MHTASARSHVDHSRRNPALGATENPLRAAYPSDVGDHQWDVISPLLERASRTGRPRQHTLRDIVDAINYRWHTGCVWRMLPHDFPPWPTVYSHFRSWQRRGLLRRIREAVLSTAPSRPVGHDTTVQAATEATVDVAAATHELRFERETPLQNE